MLTDALQLLGSLIATPSPSRDEQGTARIVARWLTDHGVADVRTLHNNVYAIAPGYNPGRRTLMLNSHHDTVRPAAGYTRNPYSPDIDNGRLYGLGSNDAGASVVSLAATFVQLMHDTTLPVNLMLAITAAEECMGELGMRAFLPHLAQQHLTPDMVLVGEPTGMQPAIAERGLVVLDAVTEGKAGHAARNEGINAIYRAMTDIEALRTFTAPITSHVLGPLRVSVTQINAGTQHNVVPDKCTYVVDVRTTDAYTNAETVELLRQAVQYSTLTPRSTRVQPSVIATDHPLVVSATALGLTPFVSPTTSDMALMHGIPSLKIGPGESSRSHSADEYVMIDEIDHALHLYPQIIKNLKI